MGNSQPEAWLRGPIDDLHPLLAAPLFTFNQVREELAERAAEFSTEQIWSSPHNATPLGYHIRHMGGSAERLATYLEGRQLSPEQMDAMKREAEPGASFDELLAQLNAALSRAEQIIRSVDPTKFTEARSVGRKQLPTTVAGLLVHIAEHTQRHLGQVVTTAKLLKT